MKLRICGTHFFTDEGVIQAVNGVDLEIYRNKTLCVVGESGCGKSVMARLILQIVTRRGASSRGLSFITASGNGQREVAYLAAFISHAAYVIRSIRKDIAMIFQEAHDVAQPHPHRGRPDHRKCCATPGRERSRRHRTHH
ncbi:MAG: ATP-binding cassette domain-containing protein [Caldilineaceae bacterium]